ncbi:Uncharacterised protein [Mycobacteroides abscessus subsp. massiliense]|uniref:hypothetical protein n=1 Tax=Mycobacteroides abscessus TaxID=36809 RepID=UPI0009A801BB|nr:hypothetical protein [Mycobacteroides abscessus]SKD36341.1 Uncharacterised protein [Mycobacteroides abscessus subsp. massiliense]SKD36550.1 Uncharacterised protein [Mycobacteroides abscessus subsp. massiliense]SKD47041.1 Uncharacterised protein [Mycobacteroides abscessus subsp. massiliense]SKD49614.1 Uncharacterised protein [Mycobacteroides abscessus subsp. massiliense]SKD58909.1 Uncharacterised protein [Mycobacteroides abscessus subsp. massiliense]
MTAIEIKDAAELIAHIARDEVLQAMKTLVTVRAIDPARMQELTAIICSLQRAYDQLTVSFDLERGRQR